MLRTRPAFLATPFFLALTWCSSSSNNDAENRDASVLDGAATDVGHASDALFGADAISTDAVAMDAAPMDAAPSDAGPTDVLGGDALLADASSADGALHDAMVSDAGCVPPLANCNGSGLTCEVNTSTNALNCGACGHSCLGAMCTSGFCSYTMGGRGDGLQHIMVAGVAYATDTNALPPGDYFIGRLTNQGMTYDQIASGTGAPGGVEGDANYFYFAVSGNPSSTVYRKAHTAAAAAAPEVLFHTSTFPAWMVIRGGILYWMTGDYISATVYKRSMTAPPSDLGTQITTVGEPRVSSFVATSTTLYWMIQKGTANILRELSVTATAAVNVPNAPTTPLGTALEPIHADTKRVYWGVTGSNAGVYTYYAGGQVVQLSNIASRSVFSDPLSDQLYFGDPFTITPLYKMTKTGGAPVEISRSFLGGDIAGSDAQFVYAFPGWGSNIPVYRYVK
jgi:hypothetical protein